ncbi:hypothetical protein [Lentzea albida]|uniref:Mg2+ and Co2+ transporter CorA n=1 Tax=Lentzea albida TaxID=65499 RepID=A0A1H9FCD4_9PSEU|nr:hypothetical protein [Lentzea albida]SEQ35600.1 hypothetical protein SAMN04488000_102630 [Lentzea albida]
MRILAGDPADPDLGAEVTLGEGRLGGAAVPFLRITSGEHRKILVGEARTDGNRVEVVIRAAWSDAQGWRQSTWSPEDLPGTLAEPAHRIAEREKALTIAKVLAEGSRNTVADLRGLRYEMERQIADLLAQRKNTALRMLMAQLVELSMAVSRARDVAQEAVREGRFTTLVMRHCEAMDAGLGDEVTRLQALLSSVSTFAVAQESEAQQRFNTLAAAAAAGLGLPALILSLYGADDYLPFTWDKAWRALTPIAGVLTVAAGIILLRMPGRTTARRYLVAFGLIAGLVSVLLIAGFLAP